MKVGVPKEIKPQERRVAITPGGARELVVEGHEVLIGHNAGVSVGFTDAQYSQAGARVIDETESLFAQADMVVKVKEPQPKECAMLRAGQILFTFLHLAADQSQAQGLLHSRCTAIAYETVTDKAGKLPLLTPMSEVAGRLAAQAGACCLEGERGGRGILLGGVPGVEPANVMVIGGGVVGVSAAQVALGMGAKVTLLDTSLDRLRMIDTMYGSRITTLYSTQANIEMQAMAADLVIGAVLIPGAAAPKLLRLETIQRMQKGAVVVDVAIDQGGCFETSRPTTHANPTFIVEGVVHYCVANMPGAVARTSTLALTNATLPYVHLLAKKGTGALLENDGFLNGLNVHDGEITCLPVAQALNLPYSDPRKLLAPV